MRSLALMLLCILTMAGCSTPAETVTPPTDTPQADAPVQQDFNGSFFLELNPDTEVVVLGGGSANCVFFWDTNGAAYKILGGNATLQWTAQPNSQVLGIRTIGAETDATSPGGGSPLRWDFGSLTFPKDAWGMGFWADYSVQDATLPVAQTATLTLAFDYEGNLPKPGIGTCGGGGA